MPLTALPLALSLIWPQPRQMEAVADTLLRLPVQVQVQPAADLAGPAALLERELTGIFGAAAVQAGGGTAVCLTLAPQELTRPEEYALDSGAEGLRLRAHDTQGAFWAVHVLATLLGQARPVHGGYQVTIPRLRDWPDTSCRAFMIQGAWTPSAEDLRRNLELLARLRIRSFALEFGPQVVLDVDPAMAEGGRFSKAEARAIIEYGKSLGLKPIGYLNLLGHLERAYKKAPYTQHGGIDLRSDETYDRFVYPILAEMLDVYGPVEFFHCGMDEAWELFTWLSREGYDVADLLARHVQRVDAFLQARGVRTVIWHDMFVAPELEKTLGTPLGPANGGPPQNTAAALARLPRDVILDYWFYDPLAAYPGLDHLRGLGFTVWASPWQTPFSMVRYAAARAVPSLGTLWAGPPGCFGSSTFSAVTALYAQAVWNSAAAAPSVVPEPTLAAAAQRATNAVLWRRRTLVFPSAAALLLSPSGPRPMSLPQEGGELHYGVPLDTSTAAAIEPLPGQHRPVVDGTSAVAVVLPGGVKLVLDGVNQARAEDQLILYVAPQTRTGTNIYGAEVTISSTGTVLEVSGYGAGDHAIPAGGFVLSAHQGKDPVKAEQLQGLRPGDRVALLNAQQEWLAGYAPTRLLAELPGARTLRIDGEDTARGADELVLYHPGYGEGLTGTNEYGVEVVVREGKAVAVRDGIGNAPIPADGYVLSAHGSVPGGSAAALRGLREGDAIRLLLEKGSQRTDLSAALAGGRRVYPVGARCAALYLVVSAGAHSAAETVLAHWTVRYADDTCERIPVRYGREALAEDGEPLPQGLGGSAWLVEEPTLRCLVREWANPRPQVVVREVSLDPVPVLLDAGARRLALTAATLPP
jgi:hypothetical protein